MKSYEKYKRLIKLLFSAVTLILLVGVYGCVWIGYYNKEVLQAPFFRRGNWLVIVLYGALLIFFLQMYGGFKVGYLKRGNLLYSQILSVLFTNIFTYFQIAIIDKRFLNPVPMVIMTIAEFIVILLWTWLFQLAYGKLFPPRKMLLISGERSDYHLLEKINARDDKYEICKVVNYRRGIDKLKAEIQKYDAVIIGDMPSHDRNVLLKYCYETSIRSYSVPKISDILLRSSNELNLFDSPLLLSRNIGLTMEQQWVKRAMDISLSLAGLIIAFPFFAVIAASIKLTDGGPVFYKQTRLTKNGAKFEIYKFRTMIQDAEKIGGPQLASERDPRILPVGRLLRATRMDELPQLLNILKGDMSVVGPRPERPELAAEIEKEIPEFQYRLKVKAGLTGYAQVYGKYNTTSYDKLKLDLTYIRNYSVLLDFKLIFMTPKILFIKESTEGVTPEQK
ncbi:sugar transferase [Enterocloster lavalensis]|uniref:sugar transferase n=1 Tax=Enterocloster lavalensis TaxID=460384 RepID=UPI002665C3E5|nr:sugar transferase [Enterocloster lavalensis]